MKPALRASDVENLVGVDTGRQTLSHSKLAVFLACHRKFDLHYLRRLEPISKPRPLTMGSAFQKAIELQNPLAGVYQLDGYEPCENCNAQGTIQAGVECGVCEGRGFTGDRAPVWSQEQEDQRRKDQAVVQGAATLYLEHWPAGTDDVREFEFRVRLRSPWSGHYSRTYDLHGYADGLADLEGWVPPTEVLELFAEQAEHPMPFELIENKLVGQVSPAKVKRVAIDRQIALLRYGIWRATGRPVVRVRYRWIKKPSIKQKQGRMTKDGLKGVETVDDFCERVIADYAERPDFYLHEEDPHFVGMDDLLRLEGELWEWAEDVRAKLRRRGGQRRLFDRNTSHCTDFGGCHFLPICTGDPDAPALFQERPKRSEREDAMPELPEAHADAA